MSGRLTSGETAPIDWCDHCGAPFERLAVRVYLEENGATLRLHSACVAKREGRITDLGRTALATQRAK